MTIKKIIFVLTIAFSPIVFAQKTDKVKLKSKINYISQLNAGMLGGDEFSRVFHVKNGVSIANHFYTTIGLGLETYHGSQYLPVFLDFRYNILNRKTTPFVSISSGYLQPLTRNYYSGSNKGGFTGGAKVGVSHFFSDHVGIETSLGYRHSKIERENLYYLWSSTFSPYTTEYNMNRFELSVGLIFK